MSEDTEIHDMERRPDFVNVKTLAGQISVSKELLREGLHFDDLIVRMISRRSPEHIAAKKARREAEWHEKTAAGMVGVYDSGDYGCQSEWRKAERVESSYVEKWITAELWNRYEAAFNALIEICDEIENMT